jgi:hypothetical protein
MIPSHILKNSLMMFMALCVWVSAIPVQAATPVARVSNLTGDVLFLTENTFMPITNGQIVHEGDRLQTKNGTVDITFNDGAVMQVKPWSTAMIQEGEEKEGGLLFKTNQMVRRLTCFVGTLWFKSSATSKHKNYLQTPTAVAALVGSEMKFGYDNINSYLQIIEGGAESFGNFLQGVFPDTDSNAAEKSRIYTLINTAHDQSQNAKTDLEKAQANVATLSALVATV